MKAHEYIHPIFPPLLEAICPSSTLGTGPLEPDSTRVPSPAPTIRDESVLEAAVNALPPLACGSGAPSTYPSLGSAALDLDPQHHAEVTPLVGRETY